MKKIIHVQIYKGEKYFIAECVDLPVVTQGASLDEVVANIREAIDLHLEGDGIEEWDLLPDFVILANFEIEPIHAKA